MQNALNLTVMLHKLDHSIIHMQKWPQYSYFP